MARGARHLEKGGCGATPMESSLQRCSVGAAGQKRPRLEQDEWGTPSHCMEMIPQLSGPLNQEESAAGRADFDAKQAETCRLLILKLSGA